MVETREMYQIEDGMRRCVAQTVEWMKEVD